MTQNQITVICQLVQKVYYGTMALKAAKVKAEQNGINSNSFNDYNSAWRNMLNGVTHTRSINSDLRDNMLFIINHSFGADRLLNALAAFEQSIIYYESTHSTTMHKDRAVLAKYKAIASTRSSFPERPFTTCGY